MGTDVIIHLKTIIIKILYMCCICNERLPELPEEDEAEKDDGKNLKR